MFKWIMLLRIFYLFLVVIGYTESNLCKLVLIGSFIDMFFLFCVELRTIEHSYYHRKVTLITR